MVSCVVRKDCTLGWAAGQRGTERGQPGTMARGPGVVSAAAAANTFTASGSPGEEGAAIQWGFSTSHPKRHLCGTQMVLGLRQLQLRVQEKRACRPLTAKESLRGLAQGKRHQRLLLCPPAWQGPRRAPERLLSPCPHGLRSPRRRSASRTLGALYARSLRPQSRSRVQGL